MESNKDCLKNRILSIEVQRKSSQNDVPIFDNYISDENTSIIREKWADEVGLYIITLKNRDNSIVNIKYPVNTIIKCSVILIEENKEECQYKPDEDNKHNNIVTNPNRLSRVKKFER